MKTYEELMRALLAQPRRAPTALPGVLQPQDPAQEPTQVQPKGIVVDPPKGKTKDCGCGEAARQRREAQRAKRDADQAKG